MLNLILRFAICIVVMVTATVPVAAAENLSVATFNVDATPPLGSQLAYRLAERIVDPLSARGIVILSDQPPIVLGAVDCLGISNRGHDVWRAALAEAAAPKHSPPVA